LRQPLQLEEAQVHEVGFGPATSKRFRDDGGDDLPAARGGHEPCRLHHRDPEDVVGLEGHLPDGEPDPDGEGCLCRPSLPRRCLLHGDGAADGVDDRAECRHDAIARVLDLLTAGALDGSGKGGEVGSTQLVERGLTEAGHKVRRADEVGEQHRHHPAWPPLVHTGSLRRDGAALAEPSGITPGLRPLRGTGEFRKPLKRRCPPRVRTPDEPDLAYADVKAHLGLPDVHAEG
jgi:hypothetical protein